MKKKVIANIILNAISGVLNFKANYQTGKYQLLLNFRCIVFIQKNKCLTNSEITGFEPNRQSSVTTL